MSETPSIQWFPGHMAKTRRLMEKNVRLVDVVVEIIDARIPLSSRNPEMGRLVGGRPRLILLNKCDSADDKMTERWCRYFEKQGIAALATDCRSGKGLQKFYPALETILQSKIAQWKERGMAGRPIRVMVVGIPNVGKSSFINRIAKSKRTKVEDRPGVTRGKQWISLENGIDLLDMPGVLWPKFEDSVVGEHLAFTGAIKDDILDTELLAVRLLELLAKDYPANLEQRYKITVGQQEDGYELLQKIGRKRGMLVSGGEVNTERASIMLLDEFRGGTIGKITLEAPED